MQGAVWRASPGALLAGAVFLLLGSDATAAVPTAAVTYRTYADPGSRVDATVVILAAGDPGEKDSILATDTGSGVVMVRVLEADDAECESAPVLHTSLGTDRWCVHLSGITAGEAFKGQLAGASSVVTLTVTARHHAIVPGVVAFGAFILSILLVFFTTKLLPPRVTNLLLGRAKGDPGGVTGLADWANRAESRLSPEDILARVNWAKRNGKGQLLAAREALRQKLLSTRIPACPLRAAGTIEAARTDVTADELLTASGARATSTADRLNAVTTRADTAIQAFTEISTLLLSRIPMTDTNRPAANALVARCNLLAVDYLSEFTMDNLIKSLQDALADLRALVPGAPPPISPLVVVPVTAGGLTTAILQEIGIGIAPFVREAFAVGTAVLAVSIFMLAAVLTVFSTQYFPNQTFGTWIDYAGLAATTFGSASVAGIVAVLALFRGPQQWFA